MRRFCRIILGAVFFIAGTLKLMDPTGASLVMTEYLKFLHLNFLQGASPVLSLAMSLLETLTGAALICGVWPKIIAWISGVMMGFFTILTLALWIFNPEMDCGCFGEAIHLTHLQSLIKNLILCALWAAACLPFRKLKAPRKIKYASFTLVAISTIAFTIHSYGRLPFIDFTPFNSGSQLGIDSRFDQVPLYFRDIRDNYYDEDSYGGGRTIFVSFYKPDEKAVTEALENCRHAREEGFETYVLLSRPLGSPVDSLVYFADRKDLLSLNRSNGGYTYVSDCCIIRKWSRRAAPSKAEFADMTKRDPMNEMMESSSRDRLMFEAYLLYVFAIMLLL